MRFVHPLLVTTSMLMLAIPCARAQDTVLVTESGQSYTGKVLSNDGTTVEIETTTGATMKLPLARLTPKSQYRLRRADTAPEREAHLELAEWCVDNVLYDEAKASFRKALEFDPVMTDEIEARVAAAKTKAADEVLARAKGLQESGKPAEARQLLSRLVQDLPDEDASQEAKELLAAETGKRKQDALSRTKAAPTGDGAADAPHKADGEPFSDATRSLFEPIIASYRKMLDDTHDGLVKGGSAGIKEFEKALDEGEKIRKAADKLRPRAADDTEIAEALALVDTKLEDADVDARINLADNYMLRTSYDDAAQAVRLGLAAYPDNARLRQAMNQVTAASADNSGGGWGLLGSVAAGRGGVR